MHTILIAESLTADELAQLQKEFPPYDFLSFPHQDIGSLKADTLQQIEVIYGHQLKPSALANMHQLRWFHCTKPSFEKLCLRELLQQGHILITSTKEENLQQAAEFVMGAILEFAKCSRQWRAFSKKPSPHLEKQIYPRMWHLSDKLFLQIGLGRTGSATAQLATKLGLKVIGVQRKKSFHPHCSKTFSMEELHAILPSADIVCLAPPMEEKDLWVFGKRELELLKADSGLIALNALHLIDKQALLQTFQSGKLRGAVFDGEIKDLPPFDSPLRQWDGMFFTPEIAFYPKKQSQQAFHIFRYNLRQYLHGNYTEMKNQAFL